MQKDSKIFIAGHKGMAGSAVMQMFKKSGFGNIITRSHKELDLICQQSVENFFQQEKPEYVILAAAKVGGIHANSKYPADFIYQNLMIETNVIHQAYKANVKQLMFLGSSCIYPKIAQQPIVEEALLTGELEPTNEPYAIAKIAGIKLCESYNRQFNTDFRALMPTNLYGSNDNYDLNNSHVIPALIKKVHEAKTNNAKFVDVWGTGQACREFLHADDLAGACLYFMGLSKKTFWVNNNKRNSHINIGTGKDISIKELVVLIRKVIGYTGEVHWDSNKPDGTPRKLLDVTKSTKLGWYFTIQLEEGLKVVYEDFMTRFSESDCA